MIATASIAKHPIHPMLIPFPIGLWGFSFICDLSWCKTGNGMWNDFALYTMAGGVIGALLAALMGSVDLFTMHSSPVKKIGIWHMSINLLIVLLYLVNLFWRFTTSPQNGQVVLSGAAILLLLVSGWLGGEMVFVHGAAVDDKQKL